MLESLGPDESKWGAAASEVRRTLDAAAQIAYEIAERLADAGACRPGRTALLHSILSLRYRQREVGIGLLDSWFENKIADAEGCLNSENAEELDRTRLRAKLRFIQLMLSLTLSARPGGDSGLGLGEESRATPVAEALRAIITTLAS